jgi:hypothetical protein
MINIAIILGITAYVYSQNMLGTMSSNFGIFLERNKERLEERISIVNIRFNDSAYLYPEGKYSPLLNITVLNTGVRHVEVAAIYINGTDILPHVYGVWNNTGVPPESVPLPTNRYLIVTGDGMTFSFDDEAPIISRIRYGCVQSIKVVTVDGVMASEEWVATRGV